MTTRMRKRPTAILITALAAICLLVSACGVKPGRVDPPEGAEDSGFPHQYPDISTAPKPKAR